MTLTRATRRKLIVLGAAIVMVGGLGALRVVQQARIQSALERDRRMGMSAYEAGDYESAIPHLSRYISRRRQEPDALLAFADSRRLVLGGDNRTAHLRHALAVTRLALDLQPDSPKGWVLFMEVAAELGYVTEANEAAIAVLQHDPTNLEAHLRRLDAARSTGRDEDRSRVAREMADALPERFDVQSLALDHMCESGMRAEDLRQFVEGRRHAFEGRIAGELLGAQLALYESSIAATSRERVSQEKRLADYLTAAASLRPREFTEVVMLVQLLDRFPGIAAGVSADGLLGEHLEDPGLAGAMLEFALARAWQRGDRALPSSIAAAHPDPSTLSDEALGWIAFGLPEEPRFREALALRQSEAGRAWSGVMRAAAHVDAQDFTAAREAVAALLTSADSGHAALARYIDSICLRSVGETSLAEQQLQVLSADPIWVRARVILRELALERRDFRRALELIRCDCLPGTEGLLLEAAVALDEARYRWPIGEASGRVLADRALMNRPDEPALLALHGRAELAAGNTTRALEVADELVALGGDRDHEQVLRFAVRLAEVDAERASALRAAYDVPTIDPIVRLMHEFAGSDAPSAEIRAQVEAATAGAPPEIRLRGELLVADLRDRRGDAGASAEYQRLSEQHPTDARVQRAALESSALWADPAAVEPVIGRLRRITGDGGVAWRVYKYKLTLLLDDTEAGAAETVLGLSNVLRLAPNDVQALQLMAEARTRAGDLVQAASYATRAADTAPDDLVIALDAVDALARAGLAEEAATKLAASAGISSDSIQARARRAGLLGRYGLASQALDDWLWLAQVGDPSSRANAALALARSGMQEEAGALVGALVEADPMTSEVRVLLADTLAELGRGGEGLALLQGVGKPDAGQDRDAAIAAYMARHAETQEDLIVLEEFLLTTASAEAWAAAVQKHMGNGMIDEARRVLAVARGYVADLSVLAPLERALDPRSELDPDAYLVIARASLSSVDTGWAEELSQQLDQVVDGRATLETFIPYLEGFVRRRPEVILGWMLLGEAQASIGDRAGARATAQSMLRAVPTDPRAGLVAVNLFRRMGMAGEGLLAAREYASRLGTPTPETGAAVAEFALTGRRPDEAWDAISPWRTVLNSRFDRGLYARAALGTNRIEEAAAVVWGWDGEDVDWALEAIRMASLIAGPSERRTWLEIASERTPGSSDEVRLLLSTAWYELAVASGDRAALQTALDLTEPDAADPMTEARLSRIQGACLAQQGRQDAAIASYGRAIELDPGDPASLNNLAFLVLEHGHDPATALEYSRRAVELLRSRGAPPGALAEYLDTLGVALLRAGSPGEALGAFDEALAARPDYDYSLVGRAETLLELGRGEEARQALDGMKGFHPLLEERVRHLSSALDRYGNVTFPP